MRYLKQELGVALPHPGQNDLWVWRGANPVSTQAVSPGLGEVVLLQGVKITKAAPMVWQPGASSDPISGELWYIISDEPTTVQTFHEYSERFDIEENFLDDKSNGNEIGTL